jgi:hypothetical protein
LDGFQAELQLGQKTINASFSPGRSAPQFRTEQGNEFYLPFFNRRGGKSRLDFRIRYFGEKEAFSKRHHRYAAIGAINWGINNAVVSPINISCWWGLPVCVRKLFSSASRVL